MARSAAKCAQTTYPAHIARTGREAGRLRLSEGIHGEHVGVGIPALRVTMLRPDPPDVRDDDAGLFPGPCCYGFVSAIVVPEDRGGVIDWRSGSSAPNGWAASTRWPFPGSHRGRPCWCSMAARVPADPHPQPPITVPLSERFAFMMSVKARIEPPVRGRAEEMMHAQEASEAVNVEEL